MTAQRAITRLAPPRCSAPRGQSRVRLPLSTMHPLGGDSIPQESPSAYPADIASGGLSAKVSGRTG